MASGVERSSFANRSFPSHKETTGNKSAIISARVPNSESRLETRKRSAREHEPAIFVLRGLFHEQNINHSPVFPPVPSTINDESVADRGEGDRLLVWAGRKKTFTGYTATSRVSFDWAIHSTFDRLIA